MKDSMYFNGIAVISLLVGFMVDDIFSKIMLAIIAVVWLIGGFIIFRSEMKLDDLKFQVKMAEKDLDQSRFGMITSLLESILLEIKKKPRNKKK